MHNGVLDQALATQCYQQPAVIPASPWLNSTSPAPPKISVSVWKSNDHIHWNSTVSGREPVNLWVLQWRDHGSWNTQILPANFLVTDLSHVSPEAVSVRAVSRTGVLSEPATWQPGK